MCVVLVIEKKMSVYEKESETFPEICKFYSSFNCNTKTDLKKKFIMFLIVHVCLNYKINNEKCSFSVILLSN